MIIAIFVLVVVWFVKSMKFLKNPYKTIMIVGKKGSGKSLTLGAMCNKHLSKGKLVYSNMGVGIPLQEDYWNYDYPRESLIIIDEAGIVHDNRSFKTFDLATRDFYKYHRKRGLTVVLASQSLDVDIKIRSLLDYTIIARNLLCFCVTAKYRNNVDIVIDPMTGASRLADCEQKIKFSTRIKYLPKLVKQAEIDTNLELNKSK